MSSYLFLHPLPVCQQAYLSVFLSVWPSSCLPACLTACLIYLSVYLHAYLSVWSVHLSALLAYLSGAARRSCRAKEQLFVFQHVIHSSLFPVRRLISPSSLFHHPAACFSQEHDWVISTARTLWLSWHMTLCWGEFQYGWFCCKEPWALIPQRRQSQIVGHWIPVCSKLLWTSPGHCSLDEMLG